MVSITKGIKRMTVIATITTLSVIGGVLAPVSAAVAPTTAVGAEASAQHPNRVVTWNIKGFDQEIDGWVQAIGLWKPQVVGLQEVCKVDLGDLIKKLKDKYNLTYTHKFGYASSKPKCANNPFHWEYGQVILSAAPITQWGNVHYYDMSSERRAYMWVDTTVAGKKMRVFNTHLDHQSSSLRASQVQQLVKDARKNKPSIALGDFNAEPMTREMRPMWKWFQDADPNCRPGPTLGCQTTSHDSKKLDYIFLRGFRPPGATVYFHPASDHRAVIADLTR